MADRVRARQWRPTTFVPRLGRFRRRASCVVRAALLLLSIAGHAFAGDDPPVRQPAPSEPPPSGRVQWSLAAGPVIEVATPGDRAREYGVMVAPAVDVRITSWLAYVAEGQLATYVSPETGAIAGVVPIGFRLHGRGNTQPFLAAGAGVSWASFTNLRGLDRRLNYLTQIGTGVRHVRADTSALSVELRFNHLSNWSSAPPNLGMENIAVLVGYGWARRR